MDKRNVMLKSDVKANANVISNEKKSMTIIVPLGQTQLTEEDLEKEIEIGYGEPKEKPGVLRKYFNVRKQKLCKERTECEVLLELSPSVVYQHEAYPVVEKEVPITYRREKRPLKQSVPDKVKVNLDRSESDTDGEDYDDSSSESVEEEDNDSIQWPSSPASYVTMGVQAMGQEDDLHTAWSNLTMRLTVEEPKSTYDYYENVTQTKEMPMETYCGIQAALPDVIHVGGKFCAAAAYDAYIMFGKHMKKTPRDCVMSMLERCEKSMETSENEVGVVNRESHVEEGSRSEDEVSNEVDSENVYEINDDMSNEDIQLSSDSGGEENAITSSDSEEDPIDIVDDNKYESDEEMNIEEAVNTMDDGYDLVPNDDFFNPQLEGTLIETVDGVNLASELKVPSDLLLTIPQKEQIIDHEMNPLGVEAVVIEKDVDRDVNFDAVDSDEDTLDSGEYLLTKYGMARDYKMVREESEEDEMSEERDPETIKNLRALLEKQKRWLAHGGVKIGDRYASNHGRKNVITTKAKPKQNEPLPKLRKLVTARDPYKREKRLYNHYIDEYRNLTTVTRMIHHREYSYVGWNFQLYEDNAEEHKSLFPLKKLPHLGSKESRITHMSWMPNMKHNLVISFESYSCGLNSTWHEGYIVLSHPMAKTDYDHVYKFTSGVRHFDITFEGLMLVALEDGNIKLVKVPCPKVIQSTTPVRKHNCPVGQVLWHKTDDPVYQRFLSYGADGVVMLWWYRPQFPFTVFRTFYLDAIKSLGSHWDDRLFYIGLENGHIYKQMLQDISEPDHLCCAHQGAVSCIAVNPFKSDVFLTGGVDGMVKLWKGSVLLSGYSLENPISDIKWSPFRSYVWAVVTRDNFVRMYNLEVNFLAPITAQHVLSYSSCVKVAFHANIPTILMIADNFCNVFAMKISRMVIEPDIVHKEETWDPRNPADADHGLSFKQQRTRLRRVLVKILNLVQYCTPINKERIVEKLVNNCKI